MSGYKCLSDGGIRHEILNDGTYVSPMWFFFVFSRGAPRDTQIQSFGPNFWLFDREYLEDSKLQHYMSIISLQRKELSKNVSHGTVAPQRSPL